jgi:hypothetical protein
MNWSTLHNGHHHDTCSYRTLCLVEIYFTSLFFPSPCRLFSFSIPLEFYLQYEEIFLFDFCSNFDSVKCDIFFKKLWLKEKIYTFANGSQSIRLCLLGRPHGCCGVLMRQQASQWVKYGIHTIL